jgi:hypothetical protein
MSLFNDIASAIGHTVDSLAQAVGADVGVLETVVNDLDGNGIDVFSAAAKLGLSPVGFLRGIVNLMNSDPHQLLLERLTGPVKPMDEPLYQLSQSWIQVANLHNGTAQGINAHINELFQGSGPYSYSGPAAASLWETNQDYQQYFTVLVEHAQVQQVRHATLEGHVSDYLSQAPGKVNSLSMPLAAFSVLSLDTVATAPPPGVLDDPAVQGVEQAIGDVVTTGEQVPEEDPDPTGVSDGIILLILAIVIVVLVIVLIIVIIVVAIRDAIQSHQNQQKSTTTPSPTKSIPTSSMADELATQYGVPASVVQEIIDKNPGLTRDQYALLVQYYKKYGTYPYNVRTVFTGVDQNGKTRIYYITQGDLDHIRGKHIEFDTLSDEELMALIEELLQQTPDQVKKSKDGTSLAYYYDDVEIDGKYYTIGIAISATNPGRIVTTYVEDD